MPATARYGLSAFQDFFETAPGAGVQIMALICLTLVFLGMVKAGLFTKTSKKWSIRIINTVFLVFISFASLSFAFSLIPKTGESTVSAPQQKKNADAASAKGSTNPTESKSTKKRKAYPPVLKSSLPTVTLKEILTGHDEAVYSLSFASDGRLLVSAGGHDGTARIWDLESHKHIEPFAQPSHIEIHDALLTPDQKLLIVAGGTKPEFGNPGFRHGNIYYWELPDGVFSDNRNRSEVRENFIEDISLSRGGNTLGVATLNDGLKFYSLATRTSNPIVERPGKFTSVDFYGLADEILTAEPNIVSVFHGVPEGRLQSFGKSLIPPKKRYWDSDVSRSGKLFAVSCLSGSTTLLRLKKKEIVRAGFREANDSTHPKQSFRVVFHPTLPVLFAGFTNGTVEILHTPKLELLGLLQIARGNPNIRAIAVSRDGKTLAVSGDVRTISLWNLSRLLETLNPGN